MKVNLILYSSHHAFHTCNEYPGYLTSSVHHSLMGGASTHQGTVTSVCKQLVHCIRYVLFYVKKQDFEYGNKLHIRSHTTKLKKMSSNRLEPIRRSIDVLWILVILVVSVFPLGNSFVIQQQTITVIHRTSQLYNLKNDLFADISVPIRTGGVHASVIPTIKGSQVVDQKGNEFKVDSVVRVAIDGLIAYHINSKGQGSYDDKKEFIPDKSDSKKKFLLLPIGLRGRVKKVYDEDVISSNLPILVIFTPGENTEEGYDAPTKFLMHFTPFEVEVVV